MRQIVGFLQSGADRTCEGWGMNTHLIQQAARHLEHLCVEVSERNLGTDGNRAATDYVAAQFRANDLRVECQAFPCLAWEPLEETLRVGDQTFSVHAGPYSLPCIGSGPLRVVRSLEQLKGDLRGTLLLLCGELVRGQLIPKNYPFYSDPEQLRLIELLESSGALAVLAATGKNPMTTAAQSPFPLIEDGAFTLPSAYMSESEGARLAACDGHPATLHLRVRRESSSGCNVLGQVGTTPVRYVICAHVDAKRGSPGAIDNASGTVVLLLLSELLRDCNGIELVAFNGEDDYSAAGEITYVKSRPKLGQLSLCVNVDGIGFREGETAFSSYGFNASEEQRLDRVLGRPGFRRGTPWIQSDHSVFIQQGVKAIAFTTSSFDWVWANLAHTERDRSEWIDPLQLVQAAEAIRDLLRHPIVD
jgi:aminopeptidase YwaD